MFLYIYAYSSKKEKRKRCTYLCMPVVQPHGVPKRHIYTKLIVEPKNFWEKGLRETIDIYIVCKILEGGRLIRSTHNWHKG